MIIMIIIIIIIIIIIMTLNCRRLRYIGHVARMEEGMSAFKILTVKPIGKIPLVRPRREDNIRMYLKEIGINTMNWVDYAQDRNCWRVLVNTV